MSNYTREQKESIYRSLQEYVVKSIKYGLQRRWTRQQIKDFTIDNLNVKQVPELEWHQFRSISKIENIFDDIWDDYMGNNLWEEN